MRAWRKALHREEWQPWFAWHPVKAKDSLVWLQWIERCRCYAIIDEWWECRLPLSEEAGGEIVVPGGRSERWAALAVSAETSYAAGGWDGADGEVQVPQKALGQACVQVEEEVKPFWSRSKPEVLKRRWRDASLMDLAAPEMRHLIDMRFKPYLYARSGAAPEGASAPGEPHALETGASRLNGEARRVEH